MIGVLSLQGNFAMHRACFAKLKIPTIEVRQPEILSTLKGLVIPGGESSVMLKFLARNYLWSDAFLQFFEAKKPIFGTCAGVILLAKNVIPVQESFGFLDVDVMRNAYGRQLESHNIETTIQLNGQKQDLILPFIRAPKITRVGRDVKVLSYAKEEPIIVEQDHVLGATCHPEATTTLVHEYFAKKCGLHFYTKYP